MIPMPDESPTVRHAFTKVEALGQTIANEYFNRVTCMCGKTMIGEDNAILDWMEDHLSTPKSSTIPKHYITSRSNIENKNGTKYDFEEKCNCGWQSGYYEFEATLQAAYQAHTQATQIPDGD